MRGVREVTAVALLPQLDTTPTTDDPPRGLNGGRVTTCPSSVCQGARRGSGGGRGPVARPPVEHEMLWIGIDRCVVGLNIASWHFLAVLGPCLGLFAQGALAALATRNNVCNLFKYNQRC